MSKIIGDVAVLDDGTVWRLPRTQDDLSWRCTWAQETITKQDFLRIASYLDNYQYMIECMTQKKRNEVCEEIKFLIKGNKNV